MEGRIVQIDSDSAGSGGWRSYHGTARGGERRTFLLWSLPGLFEECDVLVYRSDMSLLWGKLWRVGVSDQVDS